MSLQPKQFRQQTIWPTAAETTHVAGGGNPIEMGIAPENRRERGQNGRGEVEFKTEHTYDNGAKATSWQSQYSLGKYGDRNAPQPHTNPAREAELGSGQRAMFMSPREIHERYQPLDGDRYRYDSYAQSHEFSTSGGFAMTTGSPERIARESGMETDDQLWDRKLEESQYSKRDYAMDRGDGVTGTDTFVQGLYERDSFPAQRTGHTGTWEIQEEAYLDRKVGDWRERSDDSLYDSIAQEGVKSPVRLGEATGIYDKPMIVGGHHRLAAQTDLNPDRLMPVLHHEDIWEAQHDEKTTRAYPYS